MADNMQGPNLGNFGGYGQINAASPYSGGLLQKVPSKSKKGLFSQFGDYMGIANNLFQNTGMGAQIGDFASGIGSLIGNRYGDDFSESQKASQSAIRSGLAMIPGVGQAISAATGIVDAIGTATGLNLSNVNQDSANRLGLGATATANNLVNSVPGVSMLFGMFGGKRTANYNMSEEAEEMESGYSGSVGDLRATEDVAGKRLLWGKRKANSAIDSAKQTDRILTDISRTNTQRKQSDYYQDLQNQNINRYAGQNYLGVSVGKSGMKLLSLQEARRILNERKQVEEPEKLQNGGNIPGIDTSILPEGSLHVRKNNLAELNPDLEDATKKGIPVMASEGGEIHDQVAEIENSEITFRLEVTKRLEELRKDGSEEAMIEAGKLIANEVVENTQDNVGMITEEVDDGKAK